MMIKGTLQMQEGRLEPNLEVKTSNIGPFCICYVIAFYPIVALSRVSTLIPYAILVNGNYREDHKVLHLDLLHQ